MKILYLSQYFPPEAGATQTRSYEFARFLVHRGHEVTLIAEIPNHPAGVVHPSFRHIFFKRQSLARIDVIYVPCLVFKKKNFLTRLAFYFSYMLTAAVAGFLVCRQSYQLIYATSPPLPVGMAGLVLHRVERIPFFFEVRDLWPLSAVALGELKGRLSIRMAALLERACYAAASKIIVATSGIRSALLQRGVSPDKIELIPTGTTVESFARDPKAGKAMRDSLGLEGKLVLLYAGVLGIAQGLESLLPAFKMLPAEIDCRFLIIGDGPMARPLKRQVRELQLEDRILFLGGQTRDRMPAFYSACDGAVVPLKRKEIFKGARPLKMFDAWACETPILLGIEGEAAEILYQAGGGFTYCPEDPLDFVRAIKRLYQAGETTRREMGLKAREFVAENHSIRRNAEKLERLVRQFGTRIFPPKAHE